MARIALNLEDPADLALLKTTGWRIAPGLVPGEPNQGLTAELRESPARLADYDDSWWEQDADIQERRSIGFTFAWYRIRETILAAVRGRTSLGDGSGSRPTSTTTGKSTWTGRLTGSTGSSRGITWANASRSRTARCPGRST